VAGRSTVLFCAWLAWSRYRVVLAPRDRTMASVVMALDRSLRSFGGSPTYALTDNGKTVSVDHVCGIAVRNPTIVSIGRHYGLTIATCVPADPQSKGGSKATVRIAKADLVPTDHTLRDAYESFDELEAACVVWARARTAQSSSSCTPTARLGRARSPGTR
jgi:transposase